MSIGDLIQSKLGKDVRKDYEAAIRVENKRWLKRGLEVGMRLGVSCLSTKVEDGFVDALYEKGIKRP